MPWYRITIWLKNGKMLKGVRQNESWNVDMVYNYYERKTNAHFRESNVKRIDVVMIPRNSNEANAAKKT